MLFMSSPRHAEKGMLFHLTDSDSRVDKLCLCLWCSSVLVLLRLVSGCICSWFDCLCSLVNEEDIEALFGCAWMSGQWVIKQGIWGWNKNRNLVLFYCLSLVVQQPTARGAQIIGIMHIMIMCIKLQLKYIFVLIKSFTSISIYEDTAYNHIIIYA